MSAKLIPDMVTVNRIHSPYHSRVIVVKEITQYFKPHDGGMQTNHFIADTDKNRFNRNGQHIPCHRVITHMTYWSF